MDSQNRKIFNTMVSDSNEKSIAVVSCPFSGGQPKNGAESGPNFLIQAGLLDCLKELEYKISQHEVSDIVNFNEKGSSIEDFPNCERTKNHKYVMNAANKIREAVRQKLQDGYQVLTLGGDHSIALGTVSAVFQHYPDACILWIDAHPDINTPLTTSSGNLHGCPLSFLLGMNPMPASYDWLKSNIKPDRLAYIGIRDADPEEKKIIKDLGICAYSMHEIDRYGLPNVLEKALEKINPGNTRPIHLSFDVDSMDPCVAPSTGTPVRGGLTWREGMYICERVHETGQLVSMDLVEVNPLLEDSEAVKLTVNSGIALVKSAFGQSLL